MAFRSNGDPFSQFASPAAAWRRVSESARSYRTKTLEAPPILLLPTGRFGGPALLVAGTAPSKAGRDRAKLGPSPRKVSASLPRTPRRLLENLCWAAGTEAHRPPEPWVFPSPAYHRPREDTIANQAEQSRKHYATRRILQPLGS